MVGSGLFLLAIATSGCQATLIIVLYSLLVYINGFKGSGFSVTHIDMYPPLAGILFGMTNSISSLCGIIVPNMAGAFIASGAAVARGFQARNPIPLQICRAFGLLQVKLYIGAKRPPVGMVRMSGEGGARSGVILVI
ncbi:hypothetical protein AVEN_127104-1 [Araneus ventricosus]|uniref:Uncharacterized protein n=1 Tax=Araneus ventricosus TaxID=182803 RepID=A0A4Y2GZ73_ARAVE|nr:hypothetical protein AVEN_127104-1 [Araneus ventricosus]